MSLSPKIFINGRFLCQQATGVQKYALGISLAVQKNHADIIVLVPKGSYAHRELNIKQFGWGKGFFWEQVWLPLFLLFKKKTLLINFCNSAPLLIKNQIVTIHDIAFLKNNDWFSPAFRRWYNFLIPRLCQRSSRIITVSEFVNKEIVEAFSILPKKIVVVPNGIPPIEFNKQRPYPFKYLFLTGIFNPRKNTSFILSLLTDIKKRNYHIVGVGADADIYGNMEYSNDENLHLLNYIDDRQYYTLLKHADALIFPAEYEGFGIPVLEALVMGTPVIVPDIPVYRESFGELPFYYTAGDSDSFLFALDKIKIHEPTLNDASHLKNRFNFDKSAEVLIEMVKQSHF